MPQSRREWRIMKRKQQAGFTLLETMVSLFVLLAISAIVMNGMNQMMMTQGTIANRTEMHTSVRGATELLEQEIGQAGRIAVPPRPAGAVGPWLMLTPIVVVANAPVTVAGVQFSPERKSTRLNSSHTVISYAVFCLKKKN